MGDGHGWAIISDQQKGLVDSVARILPRCEHRLCARHVYANLRRTFRGEMYKKLFWRVAKSTIDIEMKKNAKKLYDLDPQAWGLLERKGVDHFCRAFFIPHAKCDSVDNNMVEIFNAFIIEARYIPIVSMLNWMFKAVMKRVGDKNAWASKINTPIPPTILKKLDKKIEESKTWEVTRAARGLFSVNNAWAEEYVVDLNAKMCSCNSWQLNGIPCPHSIAVMREERLKPTNFVHEGYATKKLVVTYSLTLHPLNGSNMWETAPGCVVNAPYFKPKKKTTTEYFRRPEASESIRGKMSEESTRIYYSNCGFEGHNRLTYPHVVKKLKPKRKVTKRTPKPAPTVAAGSSSATVAAGSCATVAANSSGPTAAATSSCHTAAAGSSAQSATAADVVAAAAAVAARRVA